MATVEYARDTKLSISSGGLTRVREKLIHARSIEDIVSQNLIPQYGSRHPENSRFRLVDGDIAQVGNSNGTCQWLFTGTYSTDKEAISSSSTAEEEDRNKQPWELGAQNFSIDRFTISRPIFYLRDTRGNLVDFMNSANCRMQAQREVYGKEIKFIFCRKYQQGKELNLPLQPIVNLQSESVAGMLLEPYRALLFPPQTRIVLDRDDNGTLTRSYWEVSCTIRVHPAAEGWFENYPDVGTLALDGKGKPAPIYRYIPWESTNNEEKLNTDPMFGTIQDVIAAKHEYATKVSGGAAKNDTYWQAWQELPYEEMTEPLPLNSGKVYVEAMADPIKNKYNQIRGTVYSVGSFRSFNLPAGREG